MSKVITISDQTGSELQNMIREKFDKSEFYNSDRWIDLAKDLGFESLADQMELDAKHD
jgi:hypothetical protein